MRVSVGTLNVGNKSDERVTGDVVTMAKQTGVVALQEMGDRKQVVQNVRHHGLRVYEGNGQRGARSTPVVWDLAHWKVTRSWTVELTPPTNAGPGAGKRVVKAKVVNFVTMKPKRDLGPPITVGSIHAPASQQNRGRALLTMKWARALAKAVREIEGPVFIAGDFNNVKPMGRILLSLHGFKSAQAKHPKATHGKRAIDDVRVKGKRWKCVETSTVWTSSDHRGFVTVWQRRQKRHTPA